MEDAAARTIVRFFRFVVGARRTEYRRLLRAIVWDSAVTVQSFMRMVIVRRRYKEAVFANRTARHEEALSHYLTRVAKGTLGNYMPRHEEAESSERVIRRLMLEYKMPYGEALARVTQGQRSHRLSPKTTADGALWDGGSLGDSSDSDDDSIDDVLLMARKPGRVPPIV